MREPIRWEGNWPIYPSEKRTNISDKLSEIDAMLSPQFGHDGLYFALQVRDARRLLQSVIKELMCSTTTSSALAGPGPATQLSTSTAAIQVTARVKGKL